jgi:hypothetical protein
MTEPEWDSCTDAQQMLEFLQDRASQRRLMLFACGCCRRHWHLLPDESCKTAVETAERFVDRLCSEEDLQLARQQMEAEHPNLHWPQCCGSHAALAAYFAAFDARAADAFEAEHPLEGKLSSMLVALKDEVAVLIAAAACDHAREGSFAEERGVQCMLLRDIFGNPFRPLPEIDLAWVQQSDSIVQKLAEGIYDDRAFTPERMNVLADALEDAGCTDPELLGHLRGPGVHVRGCWPVDLLLGRE